MNIVLFNGETERSVVLTEAVDSRVVLRIADAPRIPDGDYAPSQILAHGEAPSTAAEYAFDCVPSAETPHGQSSKGLMGEIR